MNNIEMANRLEQLQARKNFGNGINSIQVVIYYLRKNQITLAKNAALDAKRQIRQYPKIQDWFYKVLFKNDKQGVAFAD